MNPNARPFVPSLTFQRRQRSMSVQSLPVVNRDRRIRTRPKAKPPVDVFGQVWAAVMNLFNTPSFLISVLVVAAVIYTHELDSNTSHLAKFIKKLSESTGTRDFGDWISNNLGKFYGLIMLIPYYLSFNTKYKPTVVAGMAAFICLSPQMHYFWYGILTAAAILYNRVSSKQAKFTIIGFAILLLYLRTTTSISSPNSQKPANVSRN